MSMEVSIAKLLFRFANSFDLKDWQALADTLMDEIELDYQDLRGTAGLYSREEYISTRKQTLGNLKTQHLFSNLEISPEKEHAVCRLSAVIYRQDDNGNYFNSHAIYHFHLTRFKNNEWKIKKIKQSILWNEGDPSIHKGAVC